MNDTFRVLSFNVTTCRAYAYDNYSLTFVIVLFSEDMSANELLLSLGSKGIADR